MIAPKKRGSFPVKPSWSPRTADWNERQMFCLYPPPILSQTVRLSSEVCSFREETNPFLLTLFIYRYTFTWGFHTCRQCILAIVTPLPHSCHIIPPTSNFTFFFFFFFSGGNFCLLLVLSTCLWVCATHCSFASLLGPIPLIFIFSTLNMPCECISVTRFYLKVYLFQLSMVVHVYSPRYSKGERVVESSSSRLAWAQQEVVFKKILT